MLHTFIFKYILYYFIFVNFGRSEIMFHKYCFLFNFTFLFVQFYFTCCSGAGRVAIHRLVTLWYYFLTMLKLLKEKTDLQELN